MPDSFGKRQRRDVKAKKAAAREERRTARNQRREDRAAGLVEPHAPIQANEDEDLLGVRERVAERERDAGQEPAEQE